MLITVLTIASAVIAGLITILAAVAPLTASDLDNKVLSALRFVRDIVARVIGAEPGPQPEQPEA